MLVKEAVLVESGSLFNGEDERLEIASEMPIPKAKNQEMSNYSPNHLRG
jgi:hypothetical protein